MAMENPSIELLLRAEEEAAKIVSQAKQGVCTAPLQRSVGGARRAARVRVGGRESGRVGRAQRVRAHADGCDRSRAQSACGA
jgi:hypothetical protein